MLPSERIEEIYAQQCKQPKTKQQLCPCRAVMQYLDEQHTSQYEIPKCHHGNIASNCGDCSYEELV